MTDHASPILQCLGGGQLVGGRWVRALYLDESGIGALKKEPVLVVAGAIIHADTQWKPISEEITAIIQRNQPLGAVRPKFFHAKDVYHGTKEFHRASWPEKNRQAILLGMDTLIKDFNLPIVWSAIDRKSAYKNHPYPNLREHLRDCYTTAALSCLMQAEAFMRHLDDANEVASVIFEENKELQTRLPEILDFAEEANDEVGLNFNWREYLPLTRLMDRPSSQPKAGSSILQLADYCAFAIRRAMDKRPLRMDLGHNLIAHFLRIKNADPNSEIGFWNPKFMPKAWGGHNIQFIDGKFQLVPPGT